MLSGPRLRTTIGLWLRAAVAVAVLSPLVVALLVVGVIAGLVLGAILFGFASYVIEPSLPTAVALFVVGVVCALYGSVAAVRGEIRAGRNRLLRAATPVGGGTADLRDPDGDYERYVRTLRRLAGQAAVPEPAARVHPSSTPLAYTVSDGGTPTVVVSDGLLDALPPAEAEAVLAHEVAHVANRDLRWMARATLPLIGAEEFRDTFVDEDDTDPRMLPYRFLAWALVGWGRLGAGVFSRGRELAADLAAARVTGDPGALASALVRLDGSTPESPSTDLRAVDALNVLPTATPEGSPFSSHPPTERRIEHLRALEREYERR